LLETVEKVKLGAVANPREWRSIRPGTDNGKRISRDVPRAVKRAVWERDGGQCAFASSEGRRCTERAFLEFHHVQPYATGGPANIALRCRRHNQHEAELVFGSRGALPHPG